MKTAIFNFLAWCAFTAMAAMWTLALLIERAIYRYDDED